MTDEKPRWLWLIRHAKTANPPSARDYDRPLTKRGEHEADVIGMKLAAHKGRPTFVITSSALRAETTAELLNAHLHADLVPSSELYGASAETLLDAVRNLPDDVRCAALVGHNPGVSDLVSLLDPGASTMGLPTLGTVGFSLVGDWVDAASGTLSREVSWRPKEFR